MERLRSSGRRPSRRTARRPSPIWPRAITRSPWLAPMAISARQRLPFPQAVQPTPTFRWPPQPTVVGTITDSSANPLSGVTVLFQLSTNLQQVSAAITAADGTYSIVGLAPGTYDVTVFANGYLATTQAGVVVSTTATVNASLTKSDTTLNGTLVDSFRQSSAKRVCHDIPIQLGHILGTADVNPDGSFPVTSTQGNNLVLQVTAQGYAPGTVSINVATGTTTQLNPVVLQAVAMDPNTREHTNAQPQGPIPPDGQAWADQGGGKGAIGYKVTPPSSPAAPTCPNCMPLYTNLVLPNFEAAKESARTLNDLVSKIQTAATAVTVAVGVDYCATAGPRRCGRTDKYTGLLRPDAEAIVL